MYTEGEWKSLGIMPEVRGIIITHGESVDIGALKEGVGIIARVSAAPGESKSESLANANLIASAPDMYEALNDCLLQVLPVYIRYKIQKALTKAEGKDVN